MSYTKRKEEQSSGRKYSFRRTNPVAQKARCFETVVSDAIFIFNLNIVHFIEIFPLLQRKVLCRNIKY